MKAEIVSLNPFEVREVLQGNKLNLRCNLLRLNPFEVREVLQAQISNETNGIEVSIPLKSGRCCKPSAGDYTTDAKSQSL